MEGAGRKKVKTDSPQGFLGIELEEHNMNKLYTVVNVIIDYLQHSKYIINHQIHSKQSISQITLQLLPELKQRTEKIARCLEENDFFLKQIIDLQEVKKEIPPSCLMFGVEDIEFLLMDIAREWSAECAIERNYMHTVKQLIRKYIPNCENILVPGFKNGRILVELLLEGLTVQGHEENYAHFLAANFFINRCIGRLPIYPYVSNFCNHLEQEGPYKSLMVPDFIAQNHIQEQRLTASVGEFIKMYRFQGETWDCILTCFYVERIKNVILLVKLLKQILRQKGVWVNYSSLTYQHTDIQLTYAQLMEVVKHEGFTVLEEGREINRHHYNQEKMLNGQCECTYFAVRKN